MFILDLFKFAIIGTYRHCHMPMIEFVPQFIIY